MCIALRMLILLTGLLFVFPLDSSAQSLYFSGKKVGEIRESGSVYVEGRMVGSFRPGGAVYSSGRIVGQVADGGRFYRSGRLIGELRSNGSVYKGGRKLGEIRSNVQYINLVGKLVGCRVTFAQISLLHFTFSSSKTICRKRTIDPFESMLSQSKSNSFKNF